jgi:hypothetical protein
MVNVQYPCVGLVAYTHRHGTADADSTPDTLKHSFLLVY